MMVQKERLHITTSQQLTSDNIKSLIKFDPAAELYR